MPVLSADQDGESHGNASPMTSPCHEGKAIRTNGAGALVLILRQIATTVIATAAKDERALSIRRPRQSVRR
jgi:hypothetical protein